MLSEADSKIIKQINKLTFKKTLIKISYFIIFTELIMYFLLFLISGVLMCLISYECIDTLNFPLSYELILNGISILSVFSTLCFIKGLKTQNVLYFIPCLILQLGFIIYLMYLIISATYYEYLYLEHLFYTIVLFVKIQLYIFLLIQIKHLNYSHDYIYECSKILNQNQKQKEMAECSKLKIEFA